jgi:tetratricopeptide (TPR) repeat protein
MGNRGQAEQTYRKLTETKESEDQQTKAAAHVSLGQIYLQDGKKKEAIQTLQKGEKLYEIQGNRAKAENVRESIKQIQKQPN